MKNGQTEDTFKTTTSGVLFTNQKGELFITVATHGFEDDGLIYHPNPKKGAVIGQIEAHIPYTGISIASLKPGLRYVNETFGSDSDPDGIRLDKICPAYPPHLRVYDTLVMNNPFSGNCEGVTMALGARVEGEAAKKFIKHEWIHFENGDQPIDGSCGSPIVNDEGKFVGLFRSREDSSGLCLCVSASELHEHGYDICYGVQTFT